MTSLLTTFVHRRSLLFFLTQGSVTLCPVSDVPETRASAVESSAKRQCPFGRNVWSFLNSVVNNHMSFCTKQRYLFGWKPIVANFRSKKINSAPRVGKHVKTCYSFYLLTNKRYWALSIILMPDILFFNRHLNIF